MGNIYTYLKWRGDLDFAERPFCEVDNLVLSELAYMDFSGIIPTVKEAESISLKEAAEQAQIQERHVLAVGGETKSILFSMAQTHRFQDVCLSHYEEVFDEESQTQFAAFHIGLNDGTTYIAFRGTDDSILGWQEDFSMSFQLMPAQRLAADYLQETMCDPDMRYRVGGHSKGGNLSVYAAMRCPAQLQERIIEVYSNDGPGLRESIIDLAEYQNIAAKVIRIVPEFSVIGALFEQEHPSKIVASSATGFMQHDGLTWQVEGDRFCEVPERSEQCRFCNEIFDTWIESVSMEQREAFTNDFFDSLRAGGCKNISELSQGGIDEIETILTALTTQSGRKTKIVIGKFVASLFRSCKNIDFKTLLKSKTLIQGAVCVLVGLFFIIAPDIATRSISMGAGLAAIFLLSRRLIRNACSSGTDLKQRKYKIIFYIAAISLTSFLLAKTALMFRLTNLLVGVFFLMLSYRQIKAFAAQHFQIRRGLPHLLAGLFLFAVGVTPLVFRGMEFTPYAGITGVGVLLFGIIRIAISVYRRESETVSN